jgi:hypothetical protein
VRILLPCASKKWGFHEVVLRAEVIDEMVVKSGVSADPIMVHHPLRLMFPQLWSW